MIGNYKYINNYAYGGKTVLFYKFITEGILKDNPNEDEKITEIGIEYKRLFNIEKWNKYIIKQDSNNITASSINNSDVLLKIIYPRNSLICMILNVEPNTKYLIRGYYYKNGLKYVFNEVPVTTIDGEKDTYKITEFKYASASDYSGYIDINDEEKNWIENSVKNYFLTPVNLINSITSAKKEFAVTFYKANDGCAADSRQYYNIYYRYAISEKEIRSVMVHEFGHNWMSLNSGYMYKFMEFATDIPGACCKWIDSHNYPIISSARYTYIEDAINLLAFEYSRK